MNLKMLKLSNSICHFTGILILLFFYSCATSPEMNDEYTEDILADELLWSQAETSLQKKDYKKAFTLYKQITDTSLIYTNRIKSMEYMLQIQINELKNPDLSHELLLSFKSKYPNASVYRKFYLPLAYLFLEKKRFQETINFTLQYIKKGKLLSSVEMGESCYILGISYLETGRSHDSVFYFSKANDLLQNKQKKADALKHLAGLYWEVFKDRETAYHYISRLINLKPSTAWDPEIRLLLKKIQWQFIDKNDGLKDDCISAITFDGDDIWAGSWLGGAFKFSRSKNTIKIFNTRNGLVANLIRDIKVDDSFIWIATFEGVSRFNKKNNTWNNFRSIPGVAYQRIKSILVQDRYVWICTLGTGIQRYDKIMNTWTEYSNLPQFVVRVKEDSRDRTIGFATLNNGFLLYKDGKWTHYSSKNYPQINNLAKDLAFDENYIYMASYKEGIISLNKKTGEIESLKLPKKYYINTMVLKNNRLYIGTLEDGLIIYDLSTSKTRAITIKDGMNSNNILTIEFEKDYIWIGTVDSGINIYYSPGL